MADIHRMIGEGLFALYIIVMIVAIIFGRRAQRPPTWLVGIAHALLGIQVIFGIILLLDGLGGVPWYHPVLGLAALGVLALTPVFRSRFVNGMDIAIVMGLVAVLTLAAQLTARLA